MKQKDPYDLFRQPEDYQYPTPSHDIHTGENTSVPMFKKPLRFATPLLPLPPNWDTLLPGRYSSVMGIQLVPQNSKRTALFILNIGYGVAYVSTTQLVSRQDYPIIEREQLTVVPSGGLNTSPTNAVYAIGESGADLRVLEVVLAPVGTDNPL